MCIILPASSQAVDPITWKGRGYEDVRLLLARTRRNRGGPGQASQRGRAVQALSHVDKKKLVRDNEEK